MDGEPTYEALKLKVFQPSWEKLDKTLVFQWFFSDEDGTKKNSLKIALTIKQVQEDMCYHMSLFLLGYGIHMDTSRIHYNPNSMDLIKHASIHVFWDYPSNFLGNSMTK